MSILISPKNYTTWRILKTLRTKKEASIAGSFFEIKVGLVSNNLIYK